jgi:hypothetical protein
MRPYYWFFATLLFCNMLFINCLATVSVTPATGGTGISADKSVGSGSAAFSPLGNIIINSLLAADFTAGQTNVTIILTVPAGWQFQAGAGNAVGGGNITVSNTAVTASTVTITYSSTAVNSTANSITLSGLQVQGTVKTTIAAASITRTGGTGTISGFPISTSSVAGSLSQVAGTFVKIQLLLPNEVAAPGTATGKTGTPSAQSSGTAFNVTVNAVDANWNKVSVTDNISITSTDANGTMPGASNLSGGTKTFAVTLRTLSTATITATDNADVSKTSISPSVTTNIGPFTKLQILLPGETAAPSTALGKTGTPTAPAVGASFNVIVNAVDAGWNVITSATDVVGITSSDANAVLPSNAAMIAGTVTMSVTLKAAVSKTITASDITTPAKTANTSTAVTATPTTFAKLQLLLPGEVAAPGSPTGKTGTPSVINSGTAITVTVNAVDIYWNKVTTATDNIIITSNDGLGVMPAAAPLVLGTKTYSVILKTLTTTATITATDNTDGSKNANTSPNAVVQIGPYAKFVVLTAGETLAPGTPTGKTGTPSVPVAGTAFNFTVVAVDAAFNMVASANNTVKFTSSDINAALPGNTPLAAGTLAASITFKTSGARTINAVDVVTASKKGSTSLGVVAAAFAQLQLLLPGEVAAPGTASGKTGTLPTAQNAGTSFKVIVNAVDIYWNKVLTVIDNVDITSANANFATTSAALVAGTKTITVTLKTPGTATLTATDAADITKTSTSPTVTVNTGAFAKLQLLLPGETADPGSGTGKTGTPTALVAGVPFIVKVNAVDLAWNLVSSGTDEISITSPAGTNSDANAVLPPTATLTAGTATFSVTLKTVITAGTKLAANDVTNGSRAAGTSPLVILSPNTYSQLQLLLPGEIAVPGSFTGKKNTANPPARGVAFNVVVNAVDAYWNKVTSVTNTVTLTSSDGGATLPSGAALVAGTKTFNNVKIVSASTSPLPTLTATDGTSGFHLTVDVPETLPPTATTDYFRSKTSGIWNNTLTWESSSNNSNWQDATLVPTTAANTVTISNGDVVTVTGTGTTTTDQLVVETGAQLINVSGSTLAIASGGATVAGTITNAGTISTTAGVLAFQSGGKYQHNTTTLGAIPVSTWDNLSTCEIIGYTSATGTIPGGNQTFGHFIWNCPNQNVTVGPTLLNNTTASVNDMTIISTGAGNLQMAATGGTLTVRGNFLQSGGIFELGKTSGTNSLNITGNFELAGGTIKKGTGSNLVSFIGTTKQTYTKGAGGAFEATPINFAINTNAIVDFGTSVIDGSTGAFTVLTGATLITANDDGLAPTGGTTGTVQTAGTHTYSPTATYVFNGTNTQKTGLGLPTTVGNLTIDNALGLTIPSTAATYTFNGLLKFTNGTLNMGDNAFVPGVGFSTSGNGTIKTQNTSATPIPAGKTWTVGIEYNGTADQTVVQGTYSNLAFSEAGTKIVASGTTTVTGNWSSADGEVDLVTHNPTIQFTGITQSLTDAASDGGDGVVFKNVTFGNSGTKTLTSGTFSLSTDGVLTMAGSAQLAANGNLVILSDTTGSGTVAPITGGASITGNVTVQRFITGGNIAYRGYRLISSPVSAAPGYYDMSYLKNSGTYITGPASSGFDATGNPTMYLYREDKVPGSSAFTNGYYRGVTKINNSPTYYLGTVDGDFNLPVGNGFLFFFRGNMGTLTSTVPSNITLNTLGTINQGQITVKPWFNYASGVLSSTTLTGNTSKGFNLVGNPYPSAIDWDLYSAAATPTSPIYAPDIDGFIYVVDPISKNYGIYMAGSGLGTHGVTNIIPQGLGFFVRALNPTPMIFNESAKVTAQVTGSHLLLGTPVAAAQQPLLHLQLSKDAVNTDDILIRFSATAHTTFVSGEDALYQKGNGILSLASISTNNFPLAISQLPLSNKTQVIPLKVSATTAGLYALKMTELKNLPQLYDVWLMDAYKKDSLDIKHNPTYNFNLSLTDTSTFGSKRFSLVIRQNPGYAYRLLDFSAKKGAADVLVAWKTENEANYTYFTLERSVDAGKTFDILASIPAAGLGNYSFLDKSPIKGQNQYRLKQEDINGVISYSNVVSIIYGITTTNIINTEIGIYPNPTSTSVNLIITKTADAGASYQITITNSVGKVIRSVTSSKPDWQNDVSTLLPGTYFVQVINEKDKSLVGRKSFVKL